MNYQAHYDRLIMRARFRDHSTIEGEWHHAIPRCMGGTHQRSKTIGDLISNVVKLTYAEHITAHRLLCRIYPSNTKLAYAVVRLTTYKGKVSRIMYTADRKRWVIALKNQPKRQSSPETRERISIALTGKKKDKNAVDKMRQTMIGKTHTLETKAKMRDSHLNPSSETRAKISAFNKGKVTSEETKAKMREAYKRRIESLT